jgi:GNAT superfamily N-acetyltransferase
VNSSAGVVQVACAEAPDGAVHAATIWARARARRDRAPQPYGVEETLPGIQRRLGLEGAKLLLASQSSRPLGFTLFAPRSPTLEVFYLAVDPDAWGTGVARQLLLNVEQHAREIGVGTLELWVITDNERAIRLYERAGWIGTQAVKRDTPQSRPERRFVRRIG